jgi:predicted ferric reductase
MTGPLRPGWRVGLLLTLYMALALLPLALAAARGLPPRPWLDELASGLALTAFAALLLEFLLSGRYRALSAGIGMDLTMRFHQMMALTATALLLLHPLLYRLPNAASLVWDATRQHSTGLSSAATLTGLAAWLLLPILAVLALLRSRLGFSYEAWRLSHGLGALAIAGFGTHHVIDAGRYAQHEAMRGFWLLALSLAVVALVHSYLLRPLYQRRHPYRVTGVRRVAERLWQLQLEPAAAAGLRFVAGQFVWLKFERALGRVTEHPFSIASAPAQLPRLEFLVKESGDFTASIGRLAPGTPAFVDGPYGNFTLPGRRGERIVLIAGGVGIAPLLSIARELAASGDPRPVTLLYADRNLAQLAAQDELDALARRSGLEVHYLLNEPPPGWPGLRGIADEANLARVVPAARAPQCLFFVCGPPGMIDCVELALARLGVPLSRIVSERFHYASGVTTPRERLIRAVLALVAAAQLLAVLVFALR